MLLPFRPDTDPSGARTFIRNYYKHNAEGSQSYRGSNLAQELRLSNAVVLCTMLKWCWSRMPGGVVTWPVYEGFQIGERESRMARNAFATFIPIGAGSEARRNIIFDFFDLLAAVAAHGKMNGMGGRKLSRLAGWWAFEHSDDGKGFEGGYKSWTAAADAASHLFFAYLRSCSPDTEPSLTVIERIPRSLQALLGSTEYPPETPSLLQRSTPRVVMLVDSVSPTPFALLRRAKHFEFRDNDEVLREYSEFEDPVDALTDECKRVLYAVSSINSAAALSRHGNAAQSGQESWSAFQNMGFGEIDARVASPVAPSKMNGSANGVGRGLSSQPRSRADVDRPTTPSWADFLSSGFTEDDKRSATTLTLPHDKVLPPIGSRTQTPAHLNDGSDRLAPGEMAAVTTVELDDAFWWVWMTSLSGEEPADRKAVFGRCALVETTVMNGKWLIMEEQVKGASPEPTEGVFIAPKKSIFSFTKRGRNKEKKVAKSPTPTEALERTTSTAPSKSSLAPDQASKIKKAAAELARKNDKSNDNNQRRGRLDDTSSTKTTSMMTMGMMSEASPAMKWASAYDKKAIRAQYLGDNFAGRGMSREDLSKRSSANLMSDGASTIGPPAPALSPNSAVFSSDDREKQNLPALPNEQPVPATKVPAGQEPEDAVALVEQTAPAVAPATKVPAVSVSHAEAHDTEDEAENVPLAAAIRSEDVNPLEKEVSVDVPMTPTVKVGRKPVPRSSQLPEHPAFRQKSDDSADTSAPPAPESLVQHAAPQSPTTTAANPAAVAAQRAMEAHAGTSPESQKGKPKKQPSTAGFKKLFGRKKDNPNRNSVEFNKPDTDGLAPPSESNFGRRLSLMRKKPSSKAVPTTAHPAPYVEPDVPATPDTYGQAAHSIAAVSHTDTRSDANADDEFSRFDQGPMEDMPAAIPHDEEEDDGTYEGLHAPAPQRHYNTQIASRIAPERQETQDDFATPPETVPSRQEDAQSEVTLDDPPVSTMLESDRWAKIRENAARRARRASEEHSSMQSRTGQSMRTTDDGETSGEESEYFSGHDRDKMMLTNRQPSSPASPASRPESPSSQATSTASSVLCVPEQQRKPTGRLRTPRPSRLPSATTTKSHFPLSIPSLLLSCFARIACLTRQRYHFAAEIFVRLAS